MPYGRLRPTPLPVASGRQVLELLRGLREDLARQRSEQACDAAELRRLLRAQAARAEAHYTRAGAGRGEMKALAGEVRRLAEQLAAAPGGRGGGGTPAVPRNAESPIVPAAAAAANMHGRRPGAGMELALLGNTVEDRGGDGHGGGYGDNSDGGDVGGGGGGGGGGGAEGSAYAAQTLSIKRGFLRQVTGEMAQGVGAGGRRECG